MAEPEKVILDTDMVEGFDDGIAMLMLARDPRVELLGVTTVSGNTWAEEGAALALRQLELAGLRVPVAIGAQFPLRPQRRENVALERELNGIGRDDWIGAFGTPKPGIWQAAYRDHYRREPMRQPERRHAVQFIIDTVRANPDAVTVAAIGPCTNLALAVRLAPDIVPLVKRVIYMGGAFFCPGNVTPTAEFNWWFDPEAAKIAVRSPFPAQTVVGLDVCERVAFTGSEYERFLRTLGEQPLRTLVRGTDFARRLEADAAFSHFVWDVIVAAIIIDPTLITAEVTQAVDVNDAPGPAYGQASAYARAPRGCQKVRIILGIDAHRFWDELNNPRYWSHPEQHARGEAGQQAR